MIDVWQVGWLVLSLIGVAVFLGLLWYVAEWMRGEWGGPDIIYKLIRTVIFLAGIFVAFAVVANFFGHSVVRF